jgi:SNF2 family DNA or RNA helicase
LYIVERPATITAVTTTTNYRTALGPLADVVMPHLMGEAHVVARGLAAMAVATDADLDTSNILAPGVVLFPYQRAGIVYALQARRCVIGHAMGLGKTVQAIAALAIEKRNTGSLRALVVAPPSLTLNWVREFKMFAPHLTVAVVKGQTPSEVPDTDVVIIGHSVVKHWEKALIAAQFDALVIDESQNFKSRTAQRTKSMQQVARWLDDDALVLLLSGTFVTNDPGEAAPQLQILNVIDGLFGDVFGFLDRYYPKVNKWDREPRNLAELHEILLDSCYCRLTFDQVRGQMGDRAPKGVARQSTAVEMHGKAATDYKVALAKLRSYLLEHHEEIALEEGMTIAEAERLAEEKTERSMKAEALVQLGVLRRLAGEAKIPSVISFVENLVEQGEQVIVFGWHKDVVRTIAAHFGARTIMGGDKVEAVEEAKARFQAGLDKVIVLNIKAGGTGHTLTAASQVVFAEFPWTPTDYQQAEARADRIGQTELVTSHALLAANGESTIDEALVGILNRKALIVGELLDGKADTLIEDQSVADALLDWARGA